MEIKLRKLTTKAQALIVSSRLVHASQNIKFSRDESAIADSLEVSKDKVIYGWSAIFSYLNDLKIDSPLFADFYFVCHHLKRGKGAISEEALAKLDSILGTRSHLNGATFGDIDIIAYSRIRKLIVNPLTTLSRFPRLVAWFAATENLSEKAFASSAEAVAETVAPASKQQQQQKKPKQEEPKKPENASKEAKKEAKPVAEKKEAETTAAETAPVAAESTEEKVEGAKKQTKGEKKAQKLAEKAAKPVVEAPKKVHVAKAPKGEEVDPAYQALFDSQKITRSNEGKAVMPVVGERNVLITSALPYVNNAPHLGTLIGCVLSADVFARYCRLRGYNTLYVCGTDEYGTATEMKALQEGLTPKEICDKYYKIQSDVYKWFQIDFDIFGRTTTEKHTKISQDIFLTLHKNGFITEDTMNQSFCANCDKFLADRYVNGTCPFCKHDDCHGDQCDKCSKLINPAELIDAKCTICKNPSVIKETRHCFLDLPKLEPEIEAFIDRQSKDGNWSDNAYKTSKAWIKTGLRNRCITRDLKWGTPIPLPGWEKKVMYVWFDAPIGYPSITANLVEDWEAWWKNPKNVNLYQFIGKDNIPFHCVIFPGTLLGTREDWTFLQTMSSTEYLQYESTKFSKSKSVGVFGDDAERTGIPVEVWRYYLLINRPEQNDANFQWTDFQAKNNNELLPNIGNLVQRILKFIYNKLDKKVPALDLTLLNEEDKAWLGQIWKLFQEYLGHMEKVEIKSALKVAMLISSEGNLYMQKNEPWVEANKASGRSVVSLFVLVNIIRFISAIFEPFVPTLSAKINLILGMETRTPQDERILEFITNQSDPITGLLSLVPAGQVLNNPLPIFKRIEDAEIDSLRTKYAGKKV